MIQSMTPATMGSNTVSQQTQAPDMSADMSADMPADMSSIFSPDQELEGMAKSFDEADDNII